MNCMICQGHMEYYFTKSGWKHPLLPPIVDYNQCTKCGFVQSVAHTMMADEHLADLNKVEHAYQSTNLNALDPRWQSRIRNQADVIDDAEMGKLIPYGEWVDYGCGSGALSAAVQEVCGLVLKKYDREVPPSPGYLTDAQMVNHSFDFVISTSLFEHLTRREELDRINRLVRRKGVLGIHTLVCEKVPQDPTWFYLQPAHASFFTNRAMQLLFEQWGYVSSTYHVGAQLWLWYPRDVSALLGKGIAGEMPMFKQGFADYWKGDPTQRTPA